jgi:hypothetical protein
MIPSWQLEVRRETASTAFFLRGGFFMRSNSIVSNVLAVLLLVTGSAQGGLISPGDLAFIGYNVDADDDFAVVLLADADAGTTVHFTDKEWQGSALSSGEGAATWSLSDSLAAGTVVTFSKIDSVGNAGFGPSSGTLSGSLQLAIGGETVYAFLGPNSSTPVTFLAAISNAAGDYNGSTGTLAGTGLSPGTTAVLLPAGTRGGEYSASRTDQSSLAAYLPVIGNPSLNWTTSSVNGASILPFDTQPFATPEPATCSLALLATLGVAFALRRRGGRKRGAGALVPRLRLGTPCRQAPPGDL